ncbi:MAG: aquaporin family protein [SAR324 cluster bacterium]|nr:aquaporin family protein [SAR324 cluster bacterium]
MLEIFFEHRKALFAEMLGTFALVLVGAGCVIMENHTGMSHLGLPDGKVGLTGIAFGHGLTLMAMIFALGSISGGHFNPVVSVAFWSQKKLNNDLCIGYIAAQFAGAIAAALMLAGFFPDEIALATLGTPVLAAKVSLAKGMFLEGLITFLLVITILFSTHEDNPHRAFAPIAIGMTLVGLILLAGPMTGGSANPARYLGPALVSLNLNHFFPYMFGEFAGGLIAAFVFSLIQENGFPTFVNLTESQTKKKNNTVSRPVEAASLKETIQVPTSTEAVKPATALDKNSVRNAYNLLKNGQQAEAISALKHLLSEFSQCDSEIQNRILGLKIIFEEELGPIKDLEGFSHLTAKPA